MFNLENLPKKTKIIIAFILIVGLSALIFLTIVNPLNCQTEQDLQNELNISCNSCLGKYNYTSWNDIKSVDMYKYNCMVCQDYENLPPDVCVKF